MSIDIDKFDFGFTVVDENELEAVQKLSTEASTVADGSITADKVSANFQNTYAKKGTAIALSLALG